MKLRDLIETLENLPQHAPIRFASGAIPHRLCSWRGVYAELTIDSGPKGEADTVAKLLKDACDAVGKSFTGYKGGEYEMGWDTPIWADEYGDYACIAPAGIVMQDGTAVIQTMDLWDYS